MSTPLPADVRRAVRDAQHPIIGGVASGVAEHLGLPVGWVRGFFAVSALLGGMGVMLYAGLWLVLPSGAQFVSDAPGLESATRRGRHLAD